MQAPSVVTAVEGSTVNIKQTILDEMGEPAVPHPTTTGVEVILYDNDAEGSVIASGVATPDLSPGTWQINFSIPYLEITDSAKYRVLWLLVDDEGQNHTIRDFIFIEPSEENRDTDTVYVKKLGGKESFIDVSLPFGFFPDIGDKLYISCYLNNKPEFEEIEVWKGDPNFKFFSTDNRCTLQLRDGFRPTKLEPYNFMARLERASNPHKPKMFSQSLWVVTPQVIVAANQLEAYINKARLDNVIPSLQYTIGDIVTYLYRGLNMFNNVPPYITGFNGMNMQGHLLEGWIQCAGYYALGAQLQAEGALAFDFSGQSVSLNVDRTPTIEAALGRIEQYIDAHLRPYKKMLIKAGVTSGDGSAGGHPLGFGRSFGKLFVTNSPTTRLGGAKGGGTLNGWTFSPRR